MYRLLKEKFSYLRTREGKRLLKISIISLVVIIGVGIGVYSYISYVNRLSEKKFVQAKNFYFQAQNEDKVDEREKTLEKAKNLFQEVVSQKFWWSNKQEAYLYLADCYYMLGDLDESIKILEEFNGKYPRSYFSSWAKLKLALIYEKKKSYNKAIEVYQQIEKEYPQSSIAPEALLGQARCQERVGNKKKAVEIYRRLISRYPLSNEAVLGKVILQKFALESKKS